ncbi:MAG TPA: L-histidine N(alpha)-methyltransferase [Thermoanaerobaculia bacterium]|nr:L-histidine N(alpha)-methyltransferase [Thermoanaerobaculia bacterium]
MFSESTERRPSAYNAPTARLIDMRPDVGNFMDDVVSGLVASEKRIPPKYFYDDRGSALFDRITRLPEYYPTRTEIAILEEHAEDVAALLGRRWELIEFGSGTSRKVRILLDAAVGAGTYVPIDISREALRAASNQVARAYPHVRVVAVCADYTQPLALARQDPLARRVVFFPGSTIGNFEPEQAVGFMKNVRTSLRNGDLFIVGADLQKTPSVLHAAYNDAAGVTARFNRNLLDRMNRELGATFDPRQFEHVAFYDVRRGRIEMHLRSLREQTVRVAGIEVSFRAKETIHTENSYKYTRDGFRALAEQAGFRARDVWTDDGKLFSVWILEPAVSDLRNA